MKRKTLAMLSIVALILPTIMLTATPVAATTDGIAISHELSPDHGHVADRVTSTGLVQSLNGPNGLGGRLIKLYWDEVGVSTAYLNETTTESDGSFEATFLVPADFAGEHAVFVRDEATGVYSQDTFVIEPDIQLCPKPSGIPCDDITATGTGFPAGIEVNWDTPGWVTDPEGGTVETSELGSWNAEFHVEEDDPGNYTFHVWYGTTHLYEYFIVGPWIMLDHDHGQPCEWIDIEGYLPCLKIGTTVYIYFEIPIDLQYWLGERILVGTATISTLIGYFEGEFHVPEVPTDSYTVTVTGTSDDRTVSGTASFWVVPCIEIDPVEGQVGDTITVSGRGYAQFSEVTVWMSGLIPADVPLEAIVSFYDLVNLVWAWDETNTWLILTVGFFLPVNITMTNYRGSFTATFEIPECWGGYHPIAATDDEGNANIIGWWEDYYDCPVFPDGLLFTDCSLVVNKPGILRVLPNIWTDPESGVSGQTISLYGQGLSAFEFYVWYTDIDHDYCPDLLEYCEGEIYVYKRCSGFVLDFGPNKRWIDGPYFPYMFLDYGMGHFILNGQFDDSWSRQSWPAAPWGRYSPLMLNPRGTIVSDGMSFTITLDVDYFGDLVELSLYDGWILNCTFAWEYRQVGSPFLTVPWLQPQLCELVAYRFDYIEIEFHAQWPEEDVVDLALEFFTYDYDETATTDFLIECLQVDADVECPEVDLSGIEEKLNSLEGDLDALTEELGALDAKITGLEDDEGVIVAKIETAVGTIQADLTALGAEITSIVTDSEGNIIAEIETALGTVVASLDDLDAYVTVDLDKRLATIETDLGTMEGKLVSLEGDLATIETDVGTVTTKADLLLNHTGSLPVTIALSLIAAISAIAAAVMILRKVYLA